MIFTLRFVKPMSSSNGITLFTILQKRPTLQEFHEYLYSLRQTVVEALKSIMELLPQLLW